MEQGTTPTPLLEIKIHLIRGQRVMLDSDLAELYGIPTKRLNQAVRRNAERFPADFAFHITNQELTHLKSQIVTSSLDWGGQRKPTLAFTEQGVAMLSSVLKSSTAMQVNIGILRPNSQSENRACYPPSSHMAFRTIMGYFYHI